MTFTNTRLNTIKIIHLIIAISMLPLFGCGSSDKADPLSIAGKIFLENNSPKPYAGIFVAVADTNDFNAIKNSPAKHLVTLVSVDQTSGTFFADLSKKGIRPGATVSLFAFIDKHPGSGLPNPDPGDIIGFYIHPDTLVFGITLKKGRNTGYDITVNREIYDYNAEVSGSMTSDYSGPVTLVAYKGSIDSLNFSTMNSAGIIGYLSEDKQEPTLTYRFPILPYGFNVPINHVYICAIFDTNGNGVQDPGEQIGFYSDSGDTPTPITINTGHRSGLNINIVYSIPKPSGDTLLLTGSIQLPEMPTPNAPPLFIIVAQTDTLADLIDSPSESIKYFKKYSADSRDFSIDLSPTGLSLGDRVLICILWDKDYTAGFPNPTPGDFIGYYINRETMSLQLILSENNDVILVPDKEIFDYSQQVTGMISGEFSGNVLVFAYQDELTSMDFSMIDTDKILGYQSLNKQDFQTAYRFDILPFGNPLPMNDVYIFALFDTNGNGVPDFSESIGYYSANEKQLPTLINLTGSPAINLDIDYSLSMTVPEPSKDNIEIYGSFTAADDYYLDDKPVFIIVAKTRDPYALFAAPMDVIKGFTKVTPGENDFHLDLSSTSLEQGDSAMVLALWDKDFKENPASEAYTGFPAPTLGDDIGYYQNKDTFQTYITLTEGINTLEPDDSWYFNINRTIHDTTDDNGIPSTVKFRLENGGGVFLAADDRIIITAIHKNGMTGTGTNMRMHDPDYIIATTTLTFNGNFSQSCSMTVLSAQHNDIVTDTFIINDVYLFAVLDTNKNGLPDAGEPIGFYWDAFLFFYFPKLRTITPGLNDISDTPASADNRTIRFTRSTY